MATSVGHAGTTLKETHLHLAQALSATRPEIERSRAIREVLNPEVPAGIGREVMVRWNRDNSREVLDAPPPPRGGRWKLL